MLIKPTLEKTPNQTKTHKESKMFRPCFPAILFMNMQVGVSVKNVWLQQ